MALYSLSAQAISRGKGHSACAASAYRSATKIGDDRQGVCHDYSNKEGVIFAEVIAPEHAPEWASDREALWNAVEARETRKDAQLAKEVRVALPYELTEDQNRQLLREYVTDQFTRRGMVADVAYHDPEPKIEGGPRNPHAHILLTLRGFEEDGEWSRYKSGGPDQPWDHKEALLGWREAWANHTNTALDVAGSEERVDHRSYADQGIDKEPGIHLGKDAYHAEVAGVETERGERALVIEYTNAEKSGFEPDAGEPPSGTIGRVRAYHYAATVEDGSSIYRRNDATVNAPEQVRWAEDASTPEHLDRMLSQTRDTVSVSGEDVTPETPPDTTLTEAEKRGFLDWLSDRWATWRSSDREPVTPSYSGPTEPSTEPSTGQDVTEEQDRFFLDLDAYEASSTEIAREVEGSVPETPPPPEPGPEPAPDLEPDR